MTLLRHPRLAHALMALRPGARSITDFICRDDADGLGPYLVEGSMINPPTQAEIDGVTTQQLDAAAAAKAADKVDTMDTIVFRILFNHENRIRALESKAPITAQQFIATIKSIITS